MKVQCSACHRQSDLNLQSVPLPTPYQAVVSVYIVCGHCGLQTHTHYISPALTKKQEELQEAIQSYGKYHTRRNLAQILYLRRACQELFDNEQKKYGEFVQRMVVTDGAGK